ncbi:MAG: hypothetical protein QM755_19200 [Luteolibacter sp.]
MKSTAVFCSGMIWKIHTTPISRRIAWTMSEIEEEAASELLPKGRLVLMGMNRLWRGRWGDVWIHGEEKGKLARRALSGSINVTESRKDRKGIGSLDCVVSRFFSNCRKQTMSEMDGES